MNPTSFKKRFDLVIPDNDRQAIDGAQHALASTLLQYLLELGPADIRKLPKVGPKAFDFGARTCEIAAQYPQFLPPFVKLDEFRNDVAATTYLRDLQKTLRLLLERVSETLTVAAVQADHSARAYYSVTQRGSKLGEPFARNVRDQLAANFARRAPPAAAIEVPAAPAQDGEAPHLDDDALQPPSIEE